MKNPLRPRSLDPRHIDTVRVDDERFARIRNHLGARAAYQAATQRMVMLRDGLRGGVGALPIGAYTTYSDSQAQVEHSQGPYMIAVGLGLIAASFVADHYLSKRQPVESETGRLREPLYDALPQIAVPKGQKFSDVFERYVSTLEGLTAATDEGYDRQEKFLNQLGPKRLKGVADVMYESELRELYWATLEGTRESLESKAQYTNDNLKNRSSYVDEETENAEYSTIGLASTTAGAIRAYILLGEMIQSDPPHLERERTLLDVKLQLLDELLPLDRKAGFGSWGEYVASACVEKEFLDELDQIWRLQLSPETPAMAGK